MNVGGGVTFSISLEHLLRLPKGRRNFRVGKARSYPISLFSSFSFLFYLSVSRFRESGL